MDYNFTPPSIASIYLSETIFYNSSVSPIVPNTSELIFLGEYIYIFIQ